MIAAYDGSVGLLMVDDKGRDTKPDCHGPHRYPLGVPELNTRMGYPHDQSRNLAKKMIRPSSRNPYPIRNPARKKNILAASHND